MWRPAERKTLAEILRRISILMLQLPVAGNIHVGSMWGSALSVCRADVGGHCAIQTKIFSTMRKSLQNLIAASFLLLPSFVYGQVLSFTHYTPENEINPLPSAEVHKVYQDRLGFIWIAVFSSGLVRYDGHKMELYTTEAGLKDLGVWEILEDKAGRLWIGSNEGLVVSEKPLTDYFDGRRIRFTSNISITNLIQTTILPNLLAVDSRGWVWAGTSSDGIIRYRIESLERVVADTIGTDILGEGKNLDVRSIIVRKDGSVWVGVGRGILLVFETDSPEFEVISEKQGMPKQNVHVMYESPSRILWGGCRNGILWRLEERNGKKLVVTVNSELESSIISILALSEKILLVASEGSGLLKINSVNTGQRKIYTRENGLLSDISHNLMLDREGNLWIAQSGGISKLRSNYEAFENLTATSYAGEEPFLPSPSVNSILLDKNSFESSGLWAGTSEGGVVYIRNDGESETIQTEQGLRHNWVNGLTFDKKGRLWIGTARGINCLSFDANTPLPNSRQLQQISLFGRKGRIASYRETSIFTCRNLPMLEGENNGKTVESLWFPGYRHLYCLVNDEWLVFRGASGLPLTSIHAVAVDKEGKFWVGTRDHGLYRSIIALSLSKLSELKKQNVEFHLGGGGGKFGSEIITPIFEQVWSRTIGAPTNQIETLIWRDDVLWAGTPEGLVVLEGEPVQVTTHLTQDDGLKANNVVSMAFSPVTGALWVGTNRGLTEIDPITRKIVRTVTKQDGLIDNEVWYYESVAADENGTVYFGTAKGLAIYRPDLDRSNTSLPLLRIRDARFTQDNSGNNEIAIEYCALSFANEKLVRYKTRLVGYDKNWSQETAEVKIRYTNLPAFLFSKKYTFEILACNNDGLWTETPLQYTFYVRPAWWLRWWACGFSVIFLVASFLAFQRHEMSKHKQEAENQRRAKELEEARQLQLSMLPREVPQLPHLEIAAYMKTATEVGGDYYDFHVGGDGTLTVVIGDATGHELKAGTMVTAAKSLFTTLAHEPDIVSILKQSNRTFKRMNLRGLYMALQIVKIKGNRIAVGTAGMPPLLIHRSATQRVNEITIKAMPLGSVSEFPYQQQELELSPGDTVMLMTDGFPERLNEQGDILDYGKAKIVLEEVAHQTPNEIIKHFVQVGEAWADGRPQDDDVTFVVLKVRDRNGAGPDTYR